jgi:hypothetical protein
MCPVAAVVASRVELVVLGADDLPIGLEHLARAKQLAVARERRVVRVVGRVPEFARDRAERRRTVAPVIRERRVLGPDAAVDDADHDVLAIDPAVVRTAVDGEAHESRAAVRVRMAHLVLEDADHALLQLDLVDLRRGEHRGIPVQGVRVVMELPGEGDAALAQ